MTRSSSFDFAATVPVVWRLDPLACRGPPSGRNPYLQRALLKPVQVTASKPKSCRPLARLEARSLRLPPLNI